MGFIKLDRKILEWEWYSNINTRVIFIHCLLKANWKEGTFHGRVIPRGSFVTSVNELATNTGLSIQQTRTVLSNLQSTGEITIKTTNKFSIITVTNYDLYQDDNKQNNNQITNNQQTTQQSNNKQPNNNRRNKENKKKEIINTPLPPEGENGISTKKDHGDKDHDYSKCSNVENAMYILNHLEYKERDWLLVNKDIWKCIKSWLEYKDERKPKASNHYVNYNSLTGLFDKFVKNAKRYGNEAVIQVVEDSVINTYAGVTWDKLKGFKPIETEIPSMTTDIAVDEEELPNEEWLNNFKEG